MSKEIEIDNIHYIDDCADEYLITRLMLKKDGLNATVHNYSTYSEFESSLDPGLKAPSLQSIVAVDLNLVMQSGIDVVRAMRSDERFDEVIVGICTGSEDPKDRKDALEAGADFFVTKPLDANTLIKICDEVPSLSFSGNKGDQIEVKRAIS